MLHDLMHRYAALAGPPSELSHLHALKHSCATHLLNRGESIEDVQDHLGHANIQSTLVYAKYSAKLNKIRKSFDSGLPLCLLSRPLQTSALRSEKVGVPPALRMSV